MARKSTCESVYQAGTIFFAFCWHALAGVRCARSLCAGFEERERVFDLVVFAGARRQRERPSVSGQ